MTRRYAKNVFDKDKKDNSWADVCGTN